MNCPRCQTKAKVRRTFSVDAGKTQECRCPECEYIFTVVSTVFVGLSAFMALKALEEGKIKPASLKLSVDGHDQ